MVLLIETVVEAVVVLEVLLPVVVLSEVAVVLGIKPSVAESAAAVAQGH